MTSFEYDAEGRLLRAVAESEPEWTDDDRTWLLAARAEQAESCPGCGHPMDESRDPATERTWRIVRAQCNACLVLDAERHNLAEAKRPVNGLYLGTVRNT